MKRLCGSFVLGALVALASAGAVEAQRPFVFFGGGLSIPMSDYSDFAKSGWMAQAGIGMDIGTKGLWADVEGFYGSNDHDGTDDKTNLLGGLAVLGYSISPESNVSPYVLGGLGFTRHTFDPAVGDNVSTTDFAYTGGAGLGFRVSPKVLFYIEGRYMGGDTQWIPIMAGITINFGSGSN